jgi:ABC-type glycerol-3-phosphate transport system permease component
MGFFSDLHRSIFDPHFYKDAITRSGLRVALFLFKLLLVTALVTGFSKSYYLLHSTRGIAPVINVLFGDVEIRDGRLNASREMPYELPGGLVAGLMSRFVGYANFFERVPENFVVVDTRSPAADYDAESAPKILLGESAARFSEMRMDIPYERIVGKNFNFSLPSVQAFLNKNMASFVIHFFVLSFFFGLFTVTLSVFFLSLAAYIFSVDRAKGFPYFFRIACFAITPVMVGTALVSATGVNAEWSWHVFIIISTVVMFRAMVHNSIDKTLEEKGEAL